VISPRPEKVAHISDGGSDEIPHAPPGARRPSLPWAPGPPHHPNIQRCLGGLQGPNTPGGQATRGDAKREHRSSRRRPLREEMPLRNPWSAICHFSKRQTAFRRRSRSQNAIQARTAMHSFEQLAKAAHQIDIQNRHDGSDQILHRRRRPLNGSASRVMKRLPRKPQQGADGHQMRRSASRQGPCPGRPQDVFSNERVLRRLPCQSPSSWHMQLWVPRSRSQHENGQRATTLRPTSCSPSRRSNTSE
jgi:hypothetical protein